MCCGWCAARPSAIKGAVAPRSARRSGAPSRAGVTRSIPTAPAPTNAASERVASAVPASAASTLAIAGSKATWRSVRRPWSRWCLASTRPIRPAVAEDRQRVVAEARARRPACRPRSGSRSRRGGACAPRCQSSESNGARNVVPVCRRRTRRARARARAGRRRARTSGPRSPSTATSTTSPSASAACSVARRVGDAEARERQVEPEVGLGRGAHRRGASGGGASAGTRRARAASIASRSRAGRARRGRSASERPSASARGCGRSSREVERVRRRLPVPPARGAALAASSAKSLAASGPRAAIAASTSREHALVLLQPRRPAAVNRSSSRAWRGAMPGGRASRRGTRRAPSTRRARAGGRSRRSSVRSSKTPKRLQSVRRCARVDDVDRVELDPAGRLGEARETRRGEPSAARPIELLAREEEVGDGTQGNARRGRHGRRCIAESRAEGSRAAGRGMTRSCAVLRLLRRALEHIEHPSSPRSRRCASASGWRRGTARGRNGLAQGRWRQLDGAHLLPARPCRHRLRGRRAAG